MRRGPCKRVIQGETQPVIASTATGLLQNCSIAPWPASRATYSTKARQAAEMIARFSSNSETTRKLFISLTRHGLTRLFEGRRATSRSEASVSSLRAGATGMEITCQASTSTRLPCFARARWTTSGKSRTTMASSSQTYSILRSWRSESRGRGQQSCRSILRSRSWTRISTSLSKSRAPALWVVRFR